MYDEQTLQQKILDARARGVDEQTIQARVSELRSSGQIVPSRTAMPTVQDPEQVARNTPPSDLNSSIGNGVINIAKSLASPFIKAGKTIGGGIFATGQAITAARNPDKAREIWGMDNPFKTKEELKQIDQNPTQAFIDQGVRPSAGVVSWAVPFGKGANIATKVLLPGAAVGGLQTASEEGTTLPQIVGGGVTGAAGAALLHGGSKVLKGAIKGSGQVLEKTGESLSTKALRPSPSQLYKFTQDTGEKLPEFLNKRGLEGADFNKITKHIEPLQSKFDSVVSTPDIVIPSESIQAGFSAELQRLKQSILPADQAKAKVLKQIADNFTEKYGTGGITADALTTLRKEVDKGINDFALDPAVKSPLNVARDVFQGAIRDAADQAGITIDGKSVKDAGIELSKLYKLQDIAERQQYKGKGSLPVGIINLLGTGVGGTLGGIPGAAAGMAASELATHPAVIGAGSKMASGVGEKMTTLGNALPEISGYVPGQISSRLPLISGEGNAQENYNKNNSQPNHLPDVTTNQPKSQNYITGYSPEQLMQGYMAAERAKDTASAKQLKEWYTLETDYQKNKGGKTIPAAIKQRQDLSTAGLRARQDAEDIFNADPSIVLKGLATGGLASRKFDSAVSRAVEGLLRARSGAAVPDSEVAKYKKDYAPRFGDSREVALYKLQQLKLDLMDALNNNDNVVPDTSTLPVIQ